MKRSVLACLLTLATSAAGAPSAGAAQMSLKDCVVQAIVNSPALSSGRFLVEADKADIKKKRGTTLPYLSSSLQGYEVNGAPVTVWYPLGLFQPENPSSTGTHNPEAHWAPVGMESVGITYPLLSGGSILGLNDPPPVAISRADMDQQTITNLITEAKVVFNVVTDYIYITAYHLQATTQEQMVEVATKQLEIAKAQVVVGLKLPQQVQVAQAQLDSASRGLEAARENERSFTTDLAKVIGTSDAELKLDQTPTPLTPLPPLHLFLDRVMANHPALQVQEGKVEVARQQLRVDNANFWPSANLNTSFASAQDLDYFNGSSAHPRPTAFLSYIEVVIPLYDFGQRRAAIDESKQNLLSQSETVKALDLGIRTEIAGAYNQIEQYAESASQFQSAFVKADQAADLARAQYQVGATDQLTVVSAELAALQQKVQVELTEMSERLKYAELQNLAADNWRWAP